MRRLQNFNKNASVVLLALGLVASSAQAQRNVPVTVTNDEANRIPVSAEIAPGQPFQYDIQNLEFVDDQLGVLETFRVPAGKLLVVENLSGSVYIDTGDVVAFDIRTTLNGTLAIHRLVLTAQGPAGGYGKSYTAAQPLRVYADPDTDVTIFAGRTLGGRGAMHAALSGYLVDMQ